MEDAVERLQDRLEAKGEETTKNKKYMLTKPEENLIKIYENSFLKNWEL